MNITTLVVPTDGYAQRIISDTFSESFEVTFPQTQHYLSITNPLDADIVVNVGKYDNKTVHRYETWTCETDFDAFTVNIPVEATITIETREYESRYTPQETIWIQNIQQFKSAGDIVITGTNLGSSAGTVNAAIVASGYADVDISFVVEKADTTLHDWWNGRFNATLDVTSESGAGTVVACNVAAGVGTATVRYTGEFAEGDTAELTIEGGTFFGYTVADGTATDTFIA